MAATLVTATLLEAYASVGADPYIWATYELPSVAPDGTSFVIIELPATDPQDDLYKFYPQSRVSPPPGRAYAIRLWSAGLDCLSTNYTARLLTRNDDDLIRTIYEFMRAASINRYYRYSASQFILRNQDTPSINRLYAHITNEGAVATGTIRIELVYQALQNRPF